MSVVRGKMDDYHIIQMNYEHLLDHIVADDIKDLLHQYNVLDRDDLDAVDAGDTRRAKNENLLRILHNRADAFPVFLKVLEVKGYKYVVEKLKETENAVESSLQPSPAKVQRMDNSNETFARRFWKHEDSKIRSQNNSDQSCVTLLQRIDSLRQESLTSMSELREQKRLAAVQIQVSADKHKVQINEDMETQDKILNSAFCKLEEENKARLNLLNGLEQKARTSDTAEQRRDIEMELEEVEIKTDRVGLIFSEFQPSPMMSLGRIDISSSSGHTYKGAMHWNVDRSKGVKRSLCTALSGQRSDGVASLQSTTSRANLSTLKLEFSTKLSDDSMDDCGLTDITVMSDGTVVVTDGLYVCVKSFWYTDNQLCHSRLPFDEPPWQVCRTSTTSVAVTIPSRKQIWLLDVNPQLSITRKLKVDKEYRGLVRMNNGDLAVSAIHSYTPCIEVIDMQGNLKRRLYSAMFGPTFMDRLWYLGITHKGDILVSDTSRTRLLCVSKDGEIMSTFKPEWKDCLEDPHGVCCDREGNVYLAHSTTNEICCLTSDSLVLVKTLSLNDGIPIRKPWGLCVSDEGWLYVAESDGMVKAFIINNGT